MYHTVQQFLSPVCYWFWSVFAEPAPSLLGEVSLLGPASCLTSSAGTVCWFVPVDEGSLLESSLLLELSLLKAITASSNATTTMTAKMIVLVRLAFGRTYGDVSFAIAKH
jgi:hypothetical protein